MPVKSLEKIREYLSLPNNSPRIYLGQGEEVSIKQILDAIKENPDYPIDGISNDIWERNDGYIFDLEIKAIVDAIEKYQDEIEEEMGLADEMDKAEIKELAIAIREEVLDCISVDYNLKQLCSGNINVRISMYSNYDCINSHWFESQSGYGYTDSYFGDTIDMLQLNPKAVKKMLLDKEVKVYGSWPDKSTRKALVSLDDFRQEMENSCCGANLLTFVGIIDQWDFLQGKITNVTIPKGNNCGLFSNSQGGGSILEMKLLNDFTIDLTKEWMKGYRRFGLDIDEDRSGGYGIKDVYGICQSFWGNEITINKAKKDDNIPNK